MRSNERVCADCGSRTALAMSWFRAKGLMCSILSALLSGIMFGATAPGHAADGGPILPAEDMTVLTLASDGAWGAATETYANRAIVLAIRACKAMSKRELGCGAKFTTIRAGWSVALLCGHETIIKAAMLRADAERAPTEREIELREVYHRDMPPCARVVTVKPDGMLVRLPLLASDRRNPEL